MSKAVVDENRRVIIRSRYDIAKLLRSGPRGARDFTIDVMTLPTDRRNSLERDLRRLRNACGCELGSAFLVGSFCAYLIALFAVRPSWSPWDTIWRGLAVLVISALVGKAIGMLYARARFRRLLERLHRELSVDAL